MSTVSPKVTSSAVTAAVVVVAMYLLNLLPVIAQMPPEVKGAVAVIVTGAVTFGAGYLTRDSRRGQHAA